MDAAAPTSDDTDVADILEEIDGGE